MSNVDPSATAEQRTGTFDAGRLDTLRKAQDDAQFWREAAWQVGENLPSPLPEGYHQMAPQEWRKWALKTVSALLARVEELEGFLSAYQGWE